TLLSAPRGLKEPVFWNDSHLRWSATPARAPSVAAETIGVRWTLPPILRAAARISSSGIIASAFRARRANGSSPPRPQLVPGGARTRAPRQLIERAAHRGEALRERLRLASDRDPDVAVGLEEEARHDEDLVLREEVDREAVAVEPAGQAREEDVPGGR